MEHEFKFVASKEDLERVARVKTFAGFKRGESRKALQKDTYLDSADLLLLKNHASLRIRQKEGDFFLNFKQGQVSGEGEFIRDEREMWVDMVEIDKIRLGISDIAPVSLAKKITGNSPLKHVIEVLNNRRFIELVNGDEKMELSLDWIKFSRDGRVVEGYEVEVENRGADQQSLSGVAGFLSERFSLIPSIWSKYERGIKLTREIEEYPLSSGVSKAVELGRQLGGTFGFPKIIAVSGPSASGKTTLVTDKIMEELSKDFVVSKLSMDNYYKGVAGDNWDRPQALDMDLLEKHLAQLRSGKSIFRPNYSFKESKRTGYKILFPGQVVVFEGIFALQDSLAKYADLRVFVDTGLHGMLLRRLMRDAYPGGRTSQTSREVLNYFLKHVVPMNALYIDPTRYNADLILQNDYDPVMEALKLGRFEVQVKYMVNLAEQDLINAGATKIASVKQQDTYYKPRKKALASAGETMRLRKEGGDMLLTYKGPYMDDEYRVRPILPIPVSSQEASMLARGYKKELVIRKKRKVFVIDGLVVNLDEVEKLGPFIEICSISRDDVEKISKLAEKFGLDKKSAIKKSYFDLSK